MTFVTGDVVVREVGRPKVSWWQVLRVVLVLGWVACAGITWWSAPGESSAAQARADLTAGRLTSFEWGDRWESDGGYFNPFQSGLRSSGGPGPVLLWHTTDGRQHYATVDGGGAGTNTTLSSGPEAEALDAELRAYDDARGLPAALPLGAIQNGLFIAGSVLFLWALISAPDPVIGTKWFWFWLVTGVPLALGLFWWLARERPWSPRALGRETRLTGWIGLGLGFLSGVAVSLLVWGLDSLLGDALVPVPR
ncbi:hypothetical protein [Actinoplanes sp. ATCC 53533]|uniref:hypothetical protein n=1 Tax=Actinoplanes sp. ATCC 53533 TaxID=1288362 RepID=UPI000F7B48CA|nr:hypothetical protein [Actinoplanes sp. ATCC 53533]